MPTSPATGKPDSHLLLHPPPIAPANPPPRLKISLDLPPIDPRPPIAPRIYKRLYSHLEKILPAAGLGTPKSRRAASAAARVPNSSPASARALPSRPTPSKDKSLAPFRTLGGTPTAQRTKTPAAAAATPATWDALSLPPWGPPAARWVCRALDHGPLIPLVLAGAEAVAAPPKTKGRKGMGGPLAASTTAVLAAVCYLAALQWEATGTATPEWVAGIERRILAAFGKARKETQLSKAGGGADAWEGWEDLERRPFRQAIMEVQDRLEVGWFDAVDELKAAVDCEEEQDQAEDEKEEQEYQMTRADTMFQDRYDFLSERKRAGYKVWKEGIMKRIEAISKNGPEPMEVDS